KSFFWKEKIELMRQESISAMTHEFKRPISSAVAQIALIPYYLEKEDSDRIAKYAENTLLELDKLTLYTERIQRISNNPNASLDLNRISVYLPDFFNRVYEKYSNITEKEIDLRIHLNNETESWIMDLL